MSAKGRAAAMFAACVACACGARTEPEISEPPECIASFGALEPMRCPAAGDAEATFVGMPLAVLTSGCDTVVIVVGRSLHVSRDGGASFDAPRELPLDVIVPSLGLPRFMPVALNETGALFALSTEGDTLGLRRSDDLGASFGEPVTIASTPDVWGPSLVVRGDEVVAYWLVRSGVVFDGAWIARSFDAGASFDPPERFGDARTGSHAYPTVCLPGEHGVVASWLECTTDDCSGDDRDGIAIGTLVASTSGPLVRTELFTLDNGVRPPLAGCAPDGRVILGWSDAPYLGSGNLVVASYDPCRGAVQTARFSDEAAIFAAGSPHSVLGDEGALLTWRHDIDAGSGIAALRREGTVISTERDPDFDANGVVDAPIAACARAGGGYALLTIGEDPRDRSDAVAVLLDGDGALIEARVVGPLHDFRAAWLSCDASGRAHFAWSSAEETTSYLALTGP